MGNKQRIPALALAVVYSGLALMAWAADGVPPPSLLDTDLSASAPAGQCSAPPGQAGEQGSGNGHKQHRRPPPGMDSDNGDGPPDGPPPGGKEGHRPPPRDGSAPQGVPPSGCGVQ